MCGIFGIERIRIERIWLGLHLQAHQQILAVLGVVGLLKAFYGDNIIVF